MKKMKLSKLPDRVPVKFQIMLAPDLTARLREYAELYAETYGVREEPADLVPFMLQAFLDGDAEFRRTSRAKGGKGKPAATTTSPAGSQPRTGPDQTVRELRKPLRMLGSHSDSRTE